MHLYYTNSLLQNMFVWLGKKSGRFADMHFGHGPIRILFLQLSKHFRK